MSHFTVLVVGENIEEQLAPYCENMDYNDEKDRQYMEFHGETSSNVISEYESGSDYKGKKHKEVYPTFEDFLKDRHGFEKDEHNGKYGYWRNPNAKWDWYVVGGRWAGFFKLKKNEKGVCGRPELMTDPAKEGLVDQAKIKQIDFAGMRIKDGEEAKERYERLERLLGIIPTLQYLWKEIIMEGGKFSHLSIDEKRNLYHNQTAKKIVEQAINSPEISKEDKDFLVWLDLEKYQVLKEKYIKDAQDGAISTFAVLKDGSWYERGKMGWWACVSDEKEDSVWEDEFNKLIKDLPEDTLLTVVDCHI